MHRRTCHRLERLGDRESSLLRSVECASDHQVGGRGDHGLDGEEPELRAGVLMTAGFHAYSVYREEAADLIGRAARLYESVGDDAHRALALIFEAGARESVTDDIARSRIGLEKGIALARRSGATPLVASGLTLWGELERKHGNYEKSRRIREESLVLARETGETRRVAMVLNNLGLIAHHLGDDDSADRMIRESLLLSAEIGFDANSAHCLIALAQQMGRRGDPELGTRLIGAADSYSDQPGLVVQPGDAPDFDRIRAEIEDVLGCKAYEAATREGRNLCLEEAVELALSSWPLLPGTPEHTRRLDLSPGSPRSRATPRCRRRGSPGRRGSTSRVRASRRRSDHPRRGRLSPWPRPDRPAH